MTNKPPYIFDQGLSLARERVELTQLLTMETSRAARLLSRQFDGADGLAGEGADVDLWDESNHDKLVTGILERVVWSGSKVPSGVAVLRRLVVVGDAGMGKTVLLEKYLRMALGQKQKSCLPVYLDIAKLPHSVGEVPKHLLEQVRLAPGVEPGTDRPHENRLLLEIERLLLKGRVIFLLDGLDQVDTNSATMNTLRDLLKHRDWSRCGFVISGRPYSVLRAYELWQSSSRPQFPWRFARLEEFTPTQQSRFLGRTADGKEERLQLVPDEGREILKVPRVLDYLRGLLDADLRDMHTPSDVYWKALGHIIDRGLNSHIGRCIGQRDDNAASDSFRPTQRQMVLDILGAIAFQMAVDFNGQGGSQQG